MDEVLDNVSNEAVPQEQDNQNVNSSPEISAEESKQQKNFRQMREKQDTLERELRMQRDMNEKLLQLATQNMPQQQQEAPDDFDLLGDDEFIQKGKLKKFLEKEKSKIVKESMQEVEKQLAKREQNQYLDRLKRTYSDFDDVVNKETLALLEEQEPELSQTISEISDPYKAYQQCYKFIKSSNLQAKTTEFRRGKEIDKKLEKNEKTVQTPQAFDKRPLAQAFKMTEDLKSQLYAEMHQYARQAG